MNGYRDRDNNLRLDSLFLEKNTSDMVEIYTLDTYTKKGIKSLHSIYLNSINDYDFAIKAFNNSFEQFRKLKELDWFNEKLNEWKLEKELKVESERRYALEALAAEGQIAAIKELNMMDSKNAATKKGRPSEEEIRRRLEEDERLQSKLKTMKSRFKLASNG